MTLSKRIWAASLAAVALVASLMGSAQLVAAAPADLRINEFLAANNTGLTDFNGDRPDWIELHNTGNTPVSLNGWSITDDAANPTKWVFPNTTVAAGAYLVVFASDKNLTTPELHTNFKLSASGEFIGLYDQNSQLIDSYDPSFPQQVDDVSYSHAGYHATPTPGAANTPAAPGIINGTVSASVPHGFYTSSQSVTLTTDEPSATIRYTLDGATPSATVGNTYSAPLTVNATTTLRATAVRADFIPGAVSAFTYLFASDIVNQPANPAGFPNSGVNGQVLNYGMDPDIVNGNQAAVIQSLQSIPSVSVTTDGANLWDPTTGIYVNALGDGAEWERPASVELIDPQGGEAGFTTEAGLRIRGGYSRTDNNPKHAFRLFFRDEYGGALQYPLFGTEGVDSFEKVDLRTAQNYSWSFGNSDRNTFLREIFSRDSQAALNDPYTRSRYYHLYLNGHYWGLYMSQERVSKEYAADYLGGNQDDYDVVKHDRDLSYANSATDGTVDAWRDLYALVSDGNVTAAEYTTIASQVDLTNLMDYYVLHAYVGEQDGAPSTFISGNKGNNWYAVRDRNNGGKWQFFAHDAEHSLGSRDLNVNINRTGPFKNPDSATYFHPGWLHQALRSNSTYNTAFLARADLLLRPGAVFGSDTTEARWLIRRAQVAPAILAESARWGDSKRNNPYTVNDWTNATDWVEANWFPNRTDIVRTQFGLGPAPSNTAPVVDPVVLLSVVAGATVSASVSATDAESNPFTFAITGLPVGVSFNPTTGAISGRAADAGSYTVQVIATDSGGASSTPVSGTWTVTYATNPGLILNEYNAVGSDKVLAAGDPYWGNVIGNGGDWFELVVTQDHLDARGYNLVISDDDDGDGINSVTDTFVLADLPVLADLRSGTIITISESLADDVSFNGASGDWWINLQADSNDNGAYITAASQSNFDTNNADWRLLILDSNGDVVASPTGEGIGIFSGVSSTEIGELEADPNDQITPASLYDDGNDSTFGSPNGFDAGFQDFGPIRFVNPLDTVEPDTTIVNPATRSQVDAGAITLSGAATDNQSGVAAVELWVRNRTTGQYLQDNGTFSAVFNRVDAVVANPGSVSTTWSYNTNLSEASYTMGSRAVDVEGNVESTQGFAPFEAVSAGVLTDTIEPDSVITPPAASPVPAGPVTIHGTASDDSSGVVQVRVSVRDRGTLDFLQANGTWAPGFNLLEATVANPASLSTAWSLAVNLPAGDYGITSRAVDLANNTETTRPYLKLTTAVVSSDNVDPDTVITAPATNPVPAGTVTLGGTVTDDSSGVDRVQVSVRNRDTRDWLQNNGTWGPGFNNLDAVVANPGSLSTTWSLSVVLPVGDFAVTPRATDTAGNVESVRPFLRFQTN